MHLAPLVFALLLQGPAKLQIHDAQKGSGAAAAPGDLITVEYTGKLMDGKQFDSSKGGPAFAFTIGQGEVIQGWDKGLVGMKVGGKRHLIIPSDMAYGKAGSPPQIPADATLQFDIELLRVDKKGATPKVDIKTTQQGTGPGAKLGDQISVHYKGTYLNGTKFDSSYDRNQPFEVTVGQRTIKGFADGLIGIKLHEKRTVIIPGALAYGPGGRGPIPPNMALRFDLERVK